RARWAQAFSFLARPELTREIARIYSRRKKQRSAISNATRAGRQARRHQQIPSSRHRHRFARGPDRALEPAHRVSDEPFQGAQEGSPVSSGSAGPREPAASTAELPSEERCRSVPQGRQLAESAEVTSRVAVPWARRPSFVKLSHSFLIVSLIQVRR